MKSIFFAIILLILANPVFAQKNKTQDSPVVPAKVIDGTHIQIRSQTTQNDNWLNISSCPLTINVKKDNPPLMTLFITNVSQATVISYQLGCVTRKADIIEVLSERKVENVKIESPAIIYLPKSSQDEYFSGLCNLSEKIAIIRVNFEDGGTWTIKK